jgi:hypothetical protein
MAVHEVQIISEKAFFKPVTQPKEECGCWAATHASPRKHNSIPTSSLKAWSRSQKEAGQQARQLRAAESRLKHSAADSLILNPKDFSPQIKFRHRQSNSLPFVAKVELFKGACKPPHEQLLARMAFAEQQQWITVQQKTFTKWYMGLLWSLGSTG